MLVKRLQLENFRPFYGVQTLWFSMDEKKNITLIHGENGVGKTTLLNAILWCLFEDTTKHFERADELLNHEAEAEGKKAYSVSVSFIEDESEYEVRRGIDIRGKPFFQAFKIMDGNYEPVPNPYNLVNSIIPRDMAHYFFFHGEGISSVEDGRVIRDSIKDVLGLSVAEIAVEDLHTIEKKARKAASQEAPDETLSDLEERITTSEEELNKNRNDLEKYIKYREEKESQIEEINKALRDLPNAADLQRQREDAEQQITFWKEKYEQYESEKADFIANKSWAIFGKGLIESSLEFIDTQLTKGRIPKPYNETFVRDLLERHECICGRPLEEHSKEWKHVRDLLLDAGNAELDNRISRARGSITELTRLKDECPDVIRKIEESQAEARDHLRDQEQKAKEFSERLRNVDVEQIHEKEKARTQFQAESKQASSSIGALERDIEGLKRQIEWLTRDRNTIAAREKRVSHLEFKRKFTADLANRLEQEISGQEESAIKTIVQKVNETLEEFSRKSYQVRFDPKTYRLNLVRKDNRPVAKSTGERLLLNLSFIATLIWYCVMRVGATGRILLPGASAPFIIDAPFGELDDTYKGATATFLPERSRQVVLLLSSSHWLGTVDESIRGRVGSEYIIQSKTTADSGPEDNIVIRGRNISQSIYGAERDISQIQEVDW